MGQWLLGMMIVLLPLEASAAEVFLENETRLATPDAIPEALLGCRVQTALPREIADWAGNVQLIESDTREGRFLDLRITEVHAGGLLGNTRSVSVTGTLRENDEEMRSFRGKRVTKQPTRDDCEALGKATIQLAQDIAGWLENYATAPPLLGDAK